MSDAACPLCGGTDIESVFQLTDVPVLCNQLWPDAETAKAAPKGDVDLALCGACALIWNASFDPRRMAYAPGYENALHFSPKFQAFAENLVSRLVERYELVGRDVIEIGCGDGYMLSKMVERGVKTATGFDPSMAGKATPFATRPGVEIVSEYFRSSQLDRPFDFIMSRHVLEHLEEPVGLLGDVRRAIGDRKVPVYIEVPNAAWMLDTVSLWDIIYEHVTYWTAASITALLRRTGFDTTVVGEGYDGQFLMAEAAPAESDRAYLPADADGIKAVARAFGRAAEAEVTQWRNDLTHLGSRAVIWGAGSKGVTFANTLGSEVEAIAAFVDVNPRKKGLMAPGLGIPVVAPEALPSIRPDLVLIANQAYESEIRVQLGVLGLDVPCVSFAGKALPVS